jgi:hypothetical protein
MGLFDWADTPGALNELFDREREAILSGRFDVLERLGAEKQRLIGLVEGASTGRDVLERLQHKADRNHGLLQAMKSGVASAMKRVAGLQDRPASLRTYDASGRQQHLHAHASRIQHRA